MFDHVPVDPACPKCQKGPPRTYRYSYSRFLWDVDRAWLIVQDGRETIELDPESVDYSVRHCNITEAHLDHVDTSFPGLIAHVWLRNYDGEITRGHVLIDGNHRAARCLRDQQPFFVYILSEEESDAILLRSPNWSDDASDSEATFAKAGSPADEP